MSDCRTALTGASLPTTPASAIPISRCCSPPATRAMPSSIMAGSIPAWPSSPSRSPMPSWPPRSSSCWKPAWRKRGMTVLTAPLDGFDLRTLSDAFYADPYPIYAALRRSEPVKCMPDGSYFLTRHGDVEAVYKDGARFSSDKRVEFRPKYGETPLYEHHTTSLVFNDAPLHSRVRRLIAGALTPRAIGLLEPSLVALVDGLLDAIAAKREVRRHRGFRRRHSRRGDRQPPRRAARRARRAARLVAGDIGGARAGALGGAARQRQSRRRGIHRLSQAS